MDLGDYWPLYRLRVRTPVVELRLPCPAQLAELAALARAGIYEDGAAYAWPVSGWTPEPPPGTERRLLQFHWRALAEWTASRWDYTPVALAAGTVVGTQDMGAKEFAASRTVSTGSWVGRRFQGRGLGTEMRQAILHLAFEGLGAEAARSAAWIENTPSLAISRALGYSDDGTTERMRGSEPAVQVNLVLTRQAWERHARGDITIEGLDACLADFLGAPDDPTRAAPIDPS
jgi:RimJ/RimL family protein N-acetyltransferase